MARYDEAGEGSAQLAAHMMTMRFRDVPWPGDWPIEQRVHVDFRLLLRGQHGPETQLVRIQNVKAMHNFIRPKFDLSRMSYEKLRW